MQVYITSVKINEHISDESRNIPPSFSHPIIPEREEHRSNESLLKYIEIKTGKVSSDIHMMAKTPQELFIYPILADTVLTASVIEGPTIGTKLPMANLAVFIDSESAL